MNSAVQRKKLFICVAVLLIFIAGICVYTLHLLNADYIHRNIYVNNINITGLDKNSARALLEKELNNIDLQSRNIVVKVMDTEININMKTINTRYNINGSIDKAWKTGRNGSLFKNIIDIYRSFFTRKDIIPGVTYDRALIIKTVKGINKQFFTEAKNAYLTYEKGKIHHFREVAGRNLDIDKNVKLIEDSIKAEKFGTVELVVNTESPGIAYDFIRNIDKSLGEFSTTFNEGDSNRSDNIRTACSRIDGRILMPGEVFSMNEGLGPRTEENGYKEAPIILKEELVPGTGGGVCQVTTTLYGAVLRAMLEVVERNRHSMLLAYIQPGQDATISGSTLDFKFRNSTAYTIYINAKVYGNRLFIALLGKDDGKNRKVNIITEILEEYEPVEEQIADPFLKPGENIVEKEAKKGLKARVYREIYYNKKLIDRQFISEDVYKPITGTVRMGGDQSTGQM